MQRRLECPICETRFEIEGGKLPAMTTCPECKREIEIKTALLEDQPKLKRPNLILPEEIGQNLSEPKLNPSNPRLDSIGIFALPGDSPETPQREASQQERNVESSVDQVKPAKRKFARRPGRFLPLATMLLLAVIAGGLLAYLPYVLKATGTVGANATPSDDSPNADSPIAAPESNHAADIATAGNMKTIRDTPISTGITVADQPAVVESSNDRQAAPSGKRELFTQKEMDGFWSDNQTRIVRLEIVNSLGTHRALGTIVDSRGWIATSFRAVAGASSIKIIQTTRSFEQFESDQALNDLCRGVIHLDPEHDVAILAINRRFVINISDLKFAVADQIAAQTPLVQFTLFDDNMPVTTRETTVLERALVADLEAEFQVPIDSRKLNAADLNWIRHENTEGAVPGAPLFTIAGELVGMGVEKLADDSSFAVPVEHLANLIARIQSDTKTNRGSNPLPIEVLSQNLEEIGLGGNDHDLVADAKSPIRDVSVSFNVAANACTAFNWQPRNQEDYSAIREFARRLLELSTYAGGLAGDEDSPSYQRQVQDRDRLNAQINKWETEMLSVLAASPPRTEKRMADFNRTVIEAVGNPDPADVEKPVYMAYLKVSLSAMDSPKTEDGADTVTMEIVGTDSNLNVPFNDQIPRMLPESGWLAIFVITGQGQLQFKRPRSDDVHEAQRAELMMVRRLEAF